jgi:hypothetical protein
VATLLGCLQDDVAGVILSDNLIDEPIRYLYVGTGIDLEAAEEVVFFLLFDLDVTVDVDLAAEVGSVEEVFVLVELFFRPALLRGSRPVRSRTVGCLPGVGIVPVPRRPIVPIASVVAGLGLVGGHRRLWLGLLTLVGVCGLFCVFFVTHRNVAVTHKNGLSIHILSPPGRGRNDEKPNEGGGLGSGYRAAEIDPSGLSKLHPHCPV